MLAVRALLILDFMCVGFRGQPCDKLAYGVGGWGDVDGVVSYVINYV